MSSYTGVSGLSGVNTFGGGNSMTGANSTSGASSMLADPNARNIQASQIQDTGLRTLLQDQFNPANSYSKLGVAKVGALTDAANQYSKVDPTKLGEWSEFLAPQLQQQAAGRSSLDNQLFVNKDKLAQFNSELGAKYSVLSPEDIQRFSAADEFNALKPLSTAESGRRLYGAGTVQSALDAYNNRIAQQQITDRNTGLFKDVNWGNLYTGDPESTRAIPESWKNKQLAKWEQYANAGFLPGQKKDGWRYSKVTSNFMFPQLTGDTWKKGNTLIRYNPQNGYTEQVDRPRTGLLGGVFKVLDPFLDKIDPLHNVVQKATTGSDTTEGQMPYFQKIAPMIIDAFLPGVGSIVGGIDAGTRGDGKGVLGALAGYGLSTGLSGVDLTGMGNIANAAAAGAIKGGVSSGIAGNSILKGALAGGLSGGIGGGMGSASSGLSAAGVNPQIAGALTRMASGALGSKIQGRKMNDRAWAQLAINSALGSMRGVPSTSKYAEKK